MPSKKIILKSSDGEMFEVDEAVAIESQTIKHMMEDNYTGNEIPLPEMTGKILAKVIEYCKTHLEADDKKGDLAKWDAAFVNVDRSTLFELTRAAYYLKIKSLRDLTCKTVVNVMIKGKSVEEIRETFGIQNDFTPEEEAAIRREYAWVLE